MGNNQDNNSLEVNTDGGAYVSKDVMSSGDFVGRDNVTNITNYYHQPWSVTVVFLIGSTVIISVIISLYWFSNIKKDLPAAPTQIPAIAQQATPTATQASLAATETPAPLLTASPLASTEAQLVSDTLAIPALPLPTETTMLTATSIPLSPSGYPCEAQIIVPVGANRVTLLYASKDGNIKQGGWVTEGAKVKITSGYDGAEIRYQIETTEGIELGWISKSFLSLSPSCPQILN